MIALDQARQHLETLGLKQAVEILDNTLDAATSRQLPYPEMLEQLLGAEVAARVLFVFGSCPFRGWTPPNTS